MTSIIKRCRSKKKKGIRAIDRFRKKKNDSRFWNYCVSRIWSQIINREVVYEWKNPWRIFCSNLWNWSLFYEHQKEKIKLDVYFTEYFVYFTEYFLAIEIDKQNHESRELIFEKKKATGIREKTWLQVY